MPMFMLNGKQYGGNGGNYQVARMSKADYDALTDAQKNDGTLRIVVDSAGNSVNYMSAQVAGAKTDDTHTNLLNPILQTWIQNGITWVGNSDGTIIANGTATASYSNYWLADANHKLHLKKGTYRLAGCPSGGSYSKYRFSVKDPNASGDIASDVGNGQTFTLSADKDVVLYLQVSTTGTTVENLTFKPMLTTDLSATYDDFVGYTGGTGRLNSDVAEHEKEISRINSDLSDKTPYLHNNITSTVLKYYSEYIGSGTDTVIVPRSGNILISAKTLGVGSVAVKIGNHDIFVLANDENVHTTNETVLPIKAGTVLGISYSNVGYSFTLYE